MENRDAILEKIQLALHDIRPYLQADGGDISFVELTEDWIVKVKLLGACGTCPFSLMTLKSGVEHALLKAIPKIKEVVAV